MDYLYDMYLKTRSNKRRSEDSVIFEILQEKNLTEILNDINDRVYQATGNYTFITSDPGRNGAREVFAAELGTRIIHHLIDCELRALFESEFTDRTYNNREDKCVIEAVNNIRDEIFNITKGYTEDAWIIKWDLKAFFMCVKHDVIYEKIINLIDEKYKGPYKDELKYLIQRCIYSLPAEHCYKKSPDWKWNPDIIEPHKSLFNQPVGQGAAIGFLIWQLFINYYHNEIDHWFTDVLKIPYFRFVDDIIIIVKDKEAALSYIFPELRKKYKELNITIQDKKFYCQHYSKGVKFCGVTIKFNRLYVNPRTTRSMFAKIQSYNKEYYKKHYINDFINSINSYFGILKQYNSYRILNKAVAAIDRRWFKYVQFNPIRRIIEPLPHNDQRHQIDDTYNLGLTKFKNKKYYWGKPVFNKKFTKILEWDNSMNEVA